MTAEGDISRCMVCGGKIIAIADPRVISLTAGLWIHLSATRRMFSRHIPVSPHG